MAFRQIAVLVLAALTLAGCVTVPDANPLAVWSPSGNFDDRKPRLIILHATEMDSAESALQVLKSQNPSGRVSAHYLISENGRIFQLVEDTKRAWHAGAGRWQGMNDINSVSIGIELDNDGIEPFTNSQIAALIILLTDLTQRYGIPVNGVIGHADMAPTRKKDPGALFPWRQLAEAGFGQWYGESLAEPPADFNAELALQRIGYDTRDLPAAVTAYRRHFRGVEQGGLDGEDLKILYDLTKK
jgi:N-acetylmuramoyl-L-alanine amidase